MTNSMVNDLPSLLSKSYAQRNCNEEDLSVSNQSFRAIAQVLHHQGGYNYVGHELRQTHHVVASSLSQNAQLNT